MTDVDAILDRPPRSISDQPESREEAGPSPFIPGTHIQFAWDSTSIGYAKGCPRLYQYVMIEGWKPNREESDDLIFGLHYHSSLEEYDRRRAVGDDHLVALRVAVRHLLTVSFGWNTKNDYKNRPNLLRTVVWYLDKFGENDAAETLILKDGRPAVEVTFKFELDWGPRMVSEQEDSEGYIIKETEPYREKVVQFDIPPELLAVGYSLPPHNQMAEIKYLLCGHLDRVVNYQSSTFVMDRKTTKSQPTQWYFTNFEPDNQMTLYSFAGRMIFHTPIKGVIIDAAQVQIDKSEFGRGITYRTQDQIDEWLTDLRFLFAQFEDYAAEGYWPMNDKFCGTFRSEALGKIGCPFRGVCGSSPQVRENFLKANFTKLEEGERWNPLKAR